MRVWRALKHRGAAILRDGVYVLPESEGNRSTFQEQIDQVHEAGGSAYLLTYRDEDGSQGEHFRALFDRSDDYDDWLNTVAAFQHGLSALDEARARKQEVQLRRTYESIRNTDYFPNSAQERAANALLTLTDAVNARFSPDEPNAADRDIERRSLNDFQTRRWATRQSLWVDRVASAWLIRRFIDRQATFLWLEQPSDCPPDAVGFDFDGAMFSHVRSLVTFEVLLRSFGLVDNAALKRIGMLVHYLDVGGVPVAEASGFLALLAGAKKTSNDDDAFLDSAGYLFDHLHTAYAAEAVE
jgi:hypothetical protein